MRLSKQLARNRFRQAPKPRAASNNPPTQAVRTAKLRTAVRQLRQTARGDPEVLAVCDEAERLIASGWTVRRGPFEPRPAKMPPEWKDSPIPPEPEGER